MIRPSWRAIELAAIALLWTVFLVGSSVWALTLPAYTSAAVQALDVPKTSGLTKADVVQLSGRVRTFVAGAEPGTLPATWKGAPGFDGSAVSHLRDVRGVISAARLATGLAALLLAGYLAVCIARGRRRPLQLGMYAGAVSALVAVVVGGLAAVFDFGVLFTAFHGVFFEGGTWVFPEDSLLIRLFPERFWMASGAAWLVLVVLGAVLLVVAARALRTASENLSASRMANNV